VAISTEEFAARAMVKPESIRVHYSKRGSYCGVIPTKLKNGRLLWPDDAVERLAQRPEEKK